MQIAEPTEVKPAAGFPTPLLRKVFADRQVFTTSGQRVPLHSNVSLEEATQLYQLVRELKPRGCLEAGLAQGISTLAILQALADNGRGEHHVFDPFQERFQNVGLVMVQRAGLADRLRFYPAFAEAVIPTLPRLQFAFIDSSHLFDLTLVEFVLTDKRLESGGLLAFHDLWLPSLQKLVRYILSNRAYRVHAASFNPEGRAPLTRRRKVKRALLRLLHAVPGSERIFREELLRPWPILCQRNLIVLEKLDDDRRDWQFHRPF